jgi:carbonic anhydrase
MADFPDWSRNGTHFSDLLNLDIKVPGEHTIEGQDSFDAEIQMFHMHLNEARMAMLGIPVRATATGYSEKFQALLDQLQIVYYNHQGECNAKRQRRRNLLEGELVGRFLSRSNKHHQSSSSSSSSSPLDDPEFQRRLQHQESLDFNPYKDFMETYYFYRYNGGLTEPPCLPVTWFVMSAPTMISLSQLRQLKHLLFTHVDGNCQKTSVHNDEQSVARPVQPLGSLRIVGKTNLMEDFPRAVMHCQEGDFEPDVLTSKLETADVDVDDLGNW